MREKTEVKNGLKETPETQHYNFLINKLLEVNKSAQATIQQNNWTIRALKEKRKKSLIEANKK